VLKAPTALGGDEVKARADWDDPMDGTGPSRITLDFTKSLICAFRYKHLGYEGVQLGFEVGGTTYIAHRFQKSNQTALPFWDNANLRPTWLTYASGTPTAATMLATCYQHTVAEGTAPGGTSTSVSTGGTLVATSTTLIPLVSVQLKSDRTNRVVAPTGFAAYPSTSGATRDVRAVLVRGGTLTGASFADHDTNHSALEVDTTATAITGGCVIGETATGSGGSIDFGSGRVLDQLGVDGDGAAIPLTLAAQTFSGSADMYGAIHLEEKT